MTTLEQMKRDAEAAKDAYAGFGKPSGYHAQRLADHVLKLVRALEKAKSQRDWHINDTAIRDVAETVRLHNERLEAILRGQADK